jgi:hypothetical protein
LDYFGASEEVEAEEARRLLSSALFSSSPFCFVSQEKEKK